MKVSAKGDYSTRAVLDLALTFHTGEVSQINAIAERQHIPVKYLESILLSLKKAGILRSKRGNQGGYSLSRPPANITVGEVLRVVDGPLAPIACVSVTAYEACPEEAACGLKSVWAEARLAVTQVLDQTTFQDVIDRQAGIRARHQSVVSTN